MQKLLVAALSSVLLMPSGTVKADSCRETLVTLMKSSQDKVPSKSVITSVTSGQKPTINHHFSNGAGDWMTEAIEPANMPWSLAVGNVLYASSDKGRTWKKVRDLNDPGHDPEVVRKEQEATAQAAQNVVCAFEEIAGIRYEKVEADLIHPQMNMTTRQTLWVHPESRRTVRSHSVMRMADMETAVTQVIEYLPELQLPQPQ